MFNHEYQIIEDVSLQAGFWRELKVNYDKIQDEIMNKGNDLTTLLQKIPVSNLREICILLKINTDGIVEHKDIMKLIIEHPDSIVLLYLQQLLGRREAYINEYYNYRYYNVAVNYIESIGLVKLLHMYVTQHTYLIELTALVEWKKRGTGTEFFIKGEREKDIVLDILNEKGAQDFCDFLKKHAKKNNDYKIAMYCESNRDTHIFIVYKKRNDVPYTDFDESKRVKNIESILFMINMRERILHIKCSTRQEIENIKKYIETKYGYELELSEKEIKDDYDISKFKKAFKSLEVLKQDGLSEFHVNRIAFTRSLLNKSPEIIIGEGKRDIWGAVVNAHAIGLINIERLNTIKSMGISFRNIKKTIKVLKMENGEVVFKLDDRELSKNYVDLIDEKFKLMFDIPLNTKLRDKLGGGQADEVDLILRTDVQSKMDTRITNILDELIEDKILKTIPIDKLKCENSDCEWEKDYNSKDIPLACPFCGCEEIIQESDNKLEVDKSKLGKFVLECVQNIYHLEDDIFIPVEDGRIGKNLMMYRFIYKKNEYRILITDKLLTKAVLKKLEKQLVPTIIVYYGIDSNQAALMTPETIQFVQFGQLYINKEDIENQKIILDRAFKELQENMMLHIISAAREASLSIKNALDKENVTDKDYKPDDFEDDVYAILKHIIYSGAKWGTSERGKPLPEGVKAFDYKQQQGKKQIEHKRAFIFDCKWNYDGKGYNVGIGEKRKAVEYINRINQSSQIALYCSENELSAHILISNKFRDKQLVELKEHINKNIIDGFSTVGVFIKVDGLVKFYDWYKKNYHNIQKYRDKFYESFYQVFTNNNEVVEERHWNTVIEAMEECFAFIKDIDTTKIRNDVIK